MTQQKLHPFLLRLWHWLFSFLIIVLIVSGIKLRSPDLKYIFSYTSAVSLHDYVGWMMAASFLFWLIYAVVTGSLRKQYIFRFKEMRGIVKQTGFYLIGYFAGKQNPFHPTPEIKFNPLQKIAYLSTMLIFIPIIVMTGILFSNILFFRKIIQGLGGIRVLDAIHISVAYISVIYLIVHIYMSTMGKTPFSHIKEMITGCEEVPEMIPVVEEEEPIENTLPGEEPLTE